MSWRDDMLAGSFRGVPFEIEVKPGELQGGRRLVKHQYPRRDLQYPEDLGRKGHDFRLECLIIGTDYFNDRDSFIAALDQEGPGVLEHPFHGRIAVSVDSWSCLDGGGEARFSVSFTEYNGPVQPSMQVDTSAFCALKAALAVEALIGEFTSTFTKPSTSILETSAFGLLDDAIGALSSISLSIPGLAEAHSLAGKFADLTAAGVSILQTPERMAREVTAVIGSVQSSVTFGVRAIQAFRNFFEYGFADPAIPETTPTRVLEKQNRDALNKLIRKNAIVNAALATANITFEVLDEAIAVRDELAVYLDRAADESSDEAYQALLDLRGALIEDINERSASLPRLVDYIPATTLPALVIAQLMYGDAALESELAARNNIAHPGFVAGGRVIQVLDHV